LRIQDFSKYSNSENPVLEISEVHFVLSRVFAGLSILTIFPTFISLIITKFLIEINSRNPKIISFFGYGIWLIISLFGSFSALYFVKLPFSIKEKFFLALLIVLQIIAGILAVIYRTHANKLLYYSTRNGNNGNQPRRG